MSTGPLAYSSRFALDGGLARLYNEYISQLAVVATPISHPPGPYPEDGLFPFGGPHCTVLPNRPTR